MDAPHIPVMLDDVIEALAPKRGEHHLDGTFGAGGYSRAILKAGSRVTAFDRDPTAISAGRGLDLPGLTLVHDRFSKMGDYVDGVDGVTLDVGVSSMQIDRAERGFSFRHDGPLDMRMGKEGPSAADVVNGLPRSQLTRIIGLLGEERQAAKVATAIERARPLDTTLDLAGACIKALGRPRGDRIHPATRTFQAIRIFVNRELEELALALHAAERILNEGGRLVVVAFHSLEDRIVKRFLQARSGRVGGSRHLPAVGGEPATFDAVAKARRPVASEQERNPRARSATLRAAMRTAAPALEPLPFRSLGVPDLSSAWEALHA